MALLEICGFETGDLSECNTVVGTVAVQSAVVRTGKYALRANLTGANTGYAPLGTWQAVGRTAGLNAVSAYARFAFRYDTKPASGMEEFARLAAFANNARAVLKLDSAGKIAVWDTTQKALGTTVLSPGRWYVIELFANAGNYELRIDGVRELIGTISAAGANNWLLLGRVASNNNTIDFYYDDVMIRDDTWPGPGRCLAIPPTSVQPSGWTAVPVGSSLIDVISGGPDGYSTYAVSPSTGISSLFFGTTPPSGQINGLKFVASTDDYAAATYSFLRMMVSGSAYATSVTDISAGTWTTRCLAFLNNPLSASPWSSLADTRFGIVTTSSNFAPIAMSQAMVMMDFGKLTLNANIPLSLTGIGWVGSGITAYLESKPPRVSGDFTAAIDGVGFTSADMTLCMEARPTPDSGSITAAIAGLSLVSGNATIFMNAVPGQLVGDLTVTVHGLDQLTAAITLHMDAIAGHEYGFMTLAMNGFIPKPSSACPILNPNAAIQISDDLITVYQESIDALINQLGKRVILEFDPIKTPCPNCVFDSISGRSTGTYKAGGPRPFARGQKCPHCKGAGFVEEAVTQCVLCLLKWSPRDLASYGVSVRDPRGVVRTKGYLYDAPAMSRAKTALVNSDISSVMQLRVTRVKGPIPVGLREDRYIIAFWELVDGA